MSLKYFPLLLFVPAIVLLIAAVASSEPNTKHRFGRFAILFICIAVFVTPLRLLKDFVIPARSTPANIVCIHNLRQIESAKQTWALENHKDTNDVVTWNDIRPYLRYLLQCPQGGTYILGKAGEQPRCSIGGTHVLPADTSDVMIRKQ